MRARIFTLLAFTVLLFGSAWGQGKTVSGKVTGPDGNPVANASVTVKGPRIGPTTGADGAYTLSVPANATALVITSVGYAEREINISNGTVFNVDVSE